jgi:hypothetical protein
MWFKWSACFASEALSSNPRPKVMGRVLRVGRSNSIEIYGCEGVRREGSS